MLTVESPYSCLVPSKGTKGSPLADGWRRSKRPREFVKGGEAGSDRTEAAALRLRAICSTRA